MYATLHPAKIDSVAHKSAVEWKKYIFSFIISPNQINHFLRYSDSFSPRVLRVVVCAYGISSHHTYFKSSAVDMSAEEGGGIRAEIGWKLFSLNEIPGLDAR